MLCNMKSTLLGAIKYNLNMVSWEILNKYKTLVLNHGVCFKIIWGTCANDSNIKVWILSLKIPSRWF